MLLEPEASHDVIKLFKRRAGQHRAAPDPTVLVVYVPLAATWPPPAPPVRHLTSPPADPWIWESETVVTSAHAFRMRMEQYR